MRDWSNSLAHHWQGHLNIARQHFPNLDVFDQTLARDPRLKAQTGGVALRTLWNVELADLRGRRPKQRRTFNAVVWATGFARDDCHVGSYSGFRFWQSDPFATHDVFRAEVPVVISGSGDGALQDFVRFVFPNQRPHQIVEALNIPVAILRELHDAEDNALRKYHWSSGKTQMDHATLQELHDLHEELAIVAFRDPHMYKALKTLLPERPNLLLCHKCSHFGQAYGLNRFLVLLANHYFGGKLLRPGQLVAAVNNRNCHNDPVACYGAPHTVQLAERNCRNGGGKMLPDEIDTRIIIIRHGFERTPFPMANIHEPRQILPLQPPQYAFL